MTKWRSFAGVALVLLLGIVIGSVGTHFYMQHRFHHFPDHEARTERLMERLTKKLALSEQQEQAIRPIVNRMAERLRAHFLETRPEAEKIVEESFADVRKLLNEDQNKKLDKLRENFHRRRPGWNR